MSHPYTVTRTEEGCSCCGKGAVYDVVGPDDTALSQSWVDADDEHIGHEEALKTADWLNTAFELGRRSVPAGEEVPWRDVATDPPPVEGSVLMWDAECSHVTTYYWIANTGPEQCLRLKYTHWKPAPRGPAVLVPVLEYEPPPETHAAAEDIPTPTTPHVQCSKSAACGLADGHAGNCEPDDDIPF